MDVEMPHAGAIPKTILYAPGLPPYTRRETVGDSTCIQWKEEMIQPETGRRISLCLASANNGLHISRAK